MAVAHILLTLLVALAALFAVRRAPPAPAPYGRRMAAIGGLLLAELVVLVAFLAIHVATGWGIRHATPPGLAIATQALRLVLVLAAGSLWVGLARDDLRSWRPIVVVGLAVPVFGWVGGGVGFIAALGLLLALDRMKWIEAVTGWRRAAALVGSAVLLVAISMYPQAIVAHGTSNFDVTLSAKPWPPALLSGDLVRGAAAELALIRPLDRAVQAVLDLFRVQLLVAVVKLLFLPIRLSGMSLKRRFLINFVLVRSIPAALSVLVLLGLGYLAFGQYKLDHVRGEFERTLARAGTAAAALAEDPGVGVASGDALDRARRWLGPDSARAAIVLRDRPPVATDTSTDSTRVPPPRVLAANRVAPATLARAAMAGADSGDARGLVAAGDTLYLAATHRLADGRSLEVYVPVDSPYIARAMAAVGGDLRVRMLVNVAVGGEGFRVAGATPRARGAQVQAREPDAAGHPHRRWFVARSYIPLGAWNGSRPPEPPHPGHSAAYRAGYAAARAARDGALGAVELYASSSLPALLRSLARSALGIGSNIVTIGIVLVLGILFSTIERFAVRSGRSIIQAVLDEMTALRSAAERFGAGDLDFRLPVHGRDEFSVVAGSFNDMAANLKRQREELVTKERLEQDLAVARAIQQRFLPQQSPGLQGLDVAGVSVPSREVGGDLFYWFTHEDGALGFTLGDVSGKSVPAALLMSNVLSALRAQAFDRPDPGECLARTNRLIVDQIEPGRFVTLFYGEASPARGELRFASAGHNPPLLLRADGAVTWLTEGGVPLGVLPDAEYRTTSTRFDPGDTLVVYSDGVTEAEGAGYESAPGEDGGMFGEQRLADVVIARRGDSAQALIGALIAAVQAFARGRPQADDITLVVVRRV